MKAEIEANLVRDFPELFTDYGGDIRETLMGFGCECGDGWSEIIREMCEQLEPLVKQWVKDNPHELDLKPRFSQIKEKYGTLRVYMTTSTDDMYVITELAEYKSETTCETCGRKGKLRGDGWMYTACYYCAKDEHKDNLELMESKYEETLNEEEKKQEEN